MRPTRGGYRDYNQNSRSNRYQQKGRYDRYPDQEEGYSEEEEESDSPRKYKQVDYDLRKTI